MPRDAFGSQGNAQSTINGARVLRHGRGKQSARTCRGSPLAAIRRRLRVTEPTPAPEHHATSKTRAVARRVITTSSYGQKSLTAARCIRHDGAVGAHTWRNKVKKRSSEGLSVFLIRHERI